MLWNADNLFSLFFVKITLASFLQFSFLTAIIISHGVDVHSWWTLFISQSISGSVLSCHCGQTLLINAKSIRWILHKASIVILRHSSPVVLLEVVLHAGFNVAPIDVDVVVPISSGLFMSEAQSMHEFMLDGVLEHAATFIQWHSLGRATWLPMLVVIQAYHSHFWIATTVIDDFDIRAVSRLISRLQLNKP